MTLKGRGLPESPTEAARLFQSATHDDPIALYNIGPLRLSGKGVAKDLDRAETALRNAARKDYLPVIQALAEFYASGADAELDLREAAIWYEKAAERGDVQAQFFVGRFYATGVGVSPNIRYAAKWFERAAENGYATAAFNVAIFYLNGSGVQRNLEAAITMVSNVPPMAASAPHRCNSESPIRPVLAFPKIRKCVGMVEQGRQ
ncbi:tetratricopeptide repeat protein [Bradyrhizobium sp. CCBAU 11357]|uniref:tetratricopeptide repeat protein n=1 Tax=Bradyrhizobium sp. CCBAU 11357 TaxID=1630808 RepID=UPI002302A912|nr:tetratricopeptide repeat protein [Bradyrhizobium sp. CCBAU 11357]